MALRECEVRFRDGRGVSHAVKVHASTVLEAAALGIKAIRETGALDDDGAFDITVVIETVTTHQVSLARVQAWLESASSSPREKARKETLR